MPKKTIYLSEEDAKVWEKARRVIRARHDKGLGAFLTPTLQQVLLWEGDAKKPKKQTSIKEKDDADDNG